MVFGWPFGTYPQWTSLRTVKSQRNSKRGSDVTQEFSPIRANGRPSLKRTMPGGCAILVLGLLLAGCAGVSTGPNSPNGPPVSVSIVPVSATMASSGVQQFSARLQNTSNTTVTWSASIGSITAEGLFSAPAVAATTTGTVSATSVADPTQSASAAVTVIPSVTPAITTLSVPIATSGVPYVATLAATWGSLPYSWSLSSGQLPVGLGLTSAGLISGTTATTGLFTFTVQVMDSSSPAKSATQSLTLTVDAAVVGGLSSTFYSMHINHPSTPWPSVLIGGERLWDANNASWSLTNTAQGVYDWTALDARLAEAQTHGVDILYDLGRTPGWAQCTASTSSPCVQTSGCAYSVDSWGGGPGQCYWPADLNADGTGTNQDWKDWVTAIATHSVNSSTAHIQYYEIWNEPNDTNFFRGTTAQLVRMTQDAACIIKGIGPGCTNRAIDPAALIVTPAATYGGSSVNDWLNGFLGSGGAPVVDVIAFHGYNGQTPEKVPSMVSTIRSGALTTYEQNGKPLFDTEFSWGLSRTATASRCSGPKLYGPASAGRSHRSLRQGQVARQRFQHVLPGPHRLRAADLQAVCRGLPGANGIGDQAIVPTSRRRR